MGAPIVNIKFRENVANAVKISPKGHVTLIIKDNTLNENIKVFKKLTDVNGLATENAEYVKDVFVGGAAKVTILNVRDSYTIDKAIKDLENIKANYVGVLSGDAQDHTKLAKYIKTADKALKTIKGVVYNLTNQDCMHLINLVNTKVTFNDSRGEVDGWKVVPYLLGVLAGMPYSRGATNYNLSGLLKTSNVEDIDAEINKGNLVLNYDGEKTKIVAGVNTLTTVDKDHSEAMKSIVVVEAMDLMRDDIDANFRLYIGGYKNTYSMQMMIITSIKAYFKELTRLEVLDPEFDNTIDQDIEAMRIYWEGKGQDTSSLSESDIRHKTCGKNVYFVSSVKILEVIENFDLRVFLTV
ncbi:phage tail sheath C-terminal domain-containing protein [Streptobacillus canis]|uniref:phage tail sheath C-terminal domain-containing protein n=1 Tax=Streptobacillus canis TaxID=2678686 RepID=UPI0012E14F17|nr:phage tail sheath C-terminal domain-containing protein [Streptobacillus canis]